MLNDHPLTYVRTDVRDVESLTPAHLLCGRRITSLPHEHKENVDDPDYMGAPAMRKQVDRHSKILDHFQSIKVEKRVHHLPEGIVDQEMRCRFDTR